MIRSFLLNLFDVSFTHFITPRIIREVYVALIAFLTLFTVVFVAGAFGQSAGTGLVVLIFAPLLFVLGVTLARIWMETLIVLFRDVEKPRKPADYQKPEVPA